MVETSKPKVIHDGTTIYSWMEKMNIYSFDYDKVVRLLQTADVGSMDEIPWSEKMSLGNAISQGIVFPNVTLILYLNGKMLDLVRRIEGIGAVSYGVDGLLPGNTLGKFYTPHPPKK